MFYSGFIFRFIIITIHIKIIRGKCFHILFLVLKFATLNEGTYHRNTDLAFRSDTPCRETLRLFPIPILFISHRGFPGVLSSTRILASPHSHSVLTCTKITCTGSASCFIIFCSASSAVSLCSCSASLSAPE